MQYEADGVRGRGRLRMRWNRVVEKVTTERELNNVDGQDWIKWRRFVWEPTSHKMKCSTNFVLLKM